MSFRERDSENKALELLCSNWGENDPFREDGSFSRKLHFNAFFPDIIQPTIIN